MPVPDALWWCDFVPVCVPVWEPVLVKELTTEAVAVAESVDWAVTLVAAVARARRVRRENCILGGEEGVD